MVPENWHICANKGLTFLLILDLAFTKYPDDVSSVQMLAPLGKKDHVVILLELQIQLLEDKQLPSFSWFYQKKKIGTRWSCHDGKLASNFVIGKRHRHVAYA